MSPTFQVIIMWLNSYISCKWMKFLSRFSFHGVLSSVNENVGWAGGAITGSNNHAMFYPSLMSVSMCLEDDWS